MSTIPYFNKLVHKGLRTKDGNVIGTIIAVDSSYITVRGRRIFQFPTQFIDLYNGREVFLSIDTNEVYKYKILTN
ncbi:MAG: hypothetical protein WCB31_10000 [Nitrososphaeraceae archaeon]